MAGEPLNYTLKVAHGLFTHDVQVPSSATFGEVKQRLEELTYLRPEEQRILFRGREVRDEEVLKESGVKDRTKLMLLENMSAKERKAEEARQAEEQAKAASAIGVVRLETDKYANQVESLDGSLKAGAQLEDKQFAILSELLMRQLLKLDGIAAEGEAKQLRRAEVKRVQALVEEVDRLKGVNQSQASLAGAPLSTSAAAPALTRNPFINGASSAQRQALTSGAMVSHSLPTQTSSSFNFTTDWEQFDSRGGGELHRAELGHQSQQSPVLSVTRSAKPPTPSPRRRTLSNSSISLSPGGASSQESGSPRKSPSPNRPSPSPPPQRPLSGSTSPRVAHRPRRSVSLQNLSIEGASPPMSPAKAKSSPTSSSRSPSPSIVDTISTFPSTAVPKPGAQNSRGGSRKLRVSVSPSPSSPSSVSSQSPQDALTTFRITTLPKASGKSRVAASPKSSSEQEKVAVKEALVISTFPPTAIRRGQLSPRAAKLAADKDGRKAVGRSQSEESNPSIPGRRSNEGASVAKGRAKSGSLWASPPESSAALPARDGSSSPPQGTAVRPNPPAWRPSQSSTALRKLVPGGTAGQAQAAGLSRTSDASEAAQTSSQPSAVQQRQRSASNPRSASSQPVAGHRPIAGSTGEILPQGQAVTQGQQFVVNSQPLLRRSWVMNGATVGGKVQQEDPPDLISFGPQVPKTSTRGPPSLPATPLPEPIRATFPHYPQPGSVSSAFNPVGSMQVQQKVAQISSYPTTYSSIALPPQTSGAPPVSGSQYTTGLQYEATNPFPGNPHSSSLGLNPRGGVSEAPMVYSNTNPFAYPSPPRTTGFIGSAAGMTLGNGFSQAQPQAGVEHSWEKF